ncbi:MAG: transglutaminase-like domain-containing protein [Pseudomonadota bacterium]|nr:transglutaminase-like domain-containing protein [Pseudomonadota bacterium]
MPHALSIASPSATTASSPAQAALPVAACEGAAAAVAAVLDRPDEALDYLEAKLAFDALVDPSLDGHRAREEVARLAEEGRRIAGAAPGEAGLLAALRTLIYRPGPWNGHRPFAYDHENFQSIRLKLIANYLRTRRGNCVSMPVLFLILAEKLGLDMTLATSPCHLYLRHRDASGRVVNLEATSGAEPARDVWIRQNFPISDRAVESGLYMRSLSRREGVALMAETVVHQLKSERRWEEAAAVCEAMLRHSPRDAFALANLGASCLNILRAEFVDKYRSVFLIPLPLRPRYALLQQKKDAAFTTAERLGWTPVQLLRAGLEGEAQMQQVERIL